LVDSEQTVKPEIPTRGKLERSLSSMYAG